MAQEKTLYDLLEVSSSASLETIEMAFERLSEKYRAGSLNAGNLDPETHFNLIKDAWQTLSNPERRQRYDARLNPPAAVLISQSADFPAGSGNGLKWAVVLLLGIGLGSYLYFSHQVELEKQRVAAQALQLEQQRLEQAAQAREASEERIRQRELAREEAQAEAQRKAQERQFEYDARNAGRQAERNLAAQESQQQRAEREAARARQRAEYEQENLLRREAQDARSRLAREQAYLRELERENRRGPAVVPSGH